MDLRQKADRDKKLQPRPQPPATRSHRRSASKLFLVQYMAEAIIPASDCQYPRCPGQRPGSSPGGTILITASRRKSSPASAPRPQMPNLKKLDVAARSSPRWRAAYEISLLRKYYSTAIYPLPFFGRNKTPPRLPAHADRLGVFS